MKCIYCGHADSRVVDSRPCNDGTGIRRKRECIACGRRFSTFEQVEQQTVFVAKKDGRREPFDLDKLRRGVIKACEKRPVSRESIEDLLHRIEKHVAQTAEREVTSREIGELVMQELKDVDEVAYVRFASVYRQFRDVNSFLQELSRLAQTTNK